MPDSEPARWVQWMAFALCSALVYTVGIPLFLGFILYSNHKRLVLQTPRCQKRYGFLYAKYEDRAWYWELVEMFRKLLFTSLIMFLAQGTATQIVIAMFISFCWLVAHLIIQAQSPFQSLQRPRPTMTTMTTQCPMPNAHSNAQ